MKQALLSLKDGTIDLVDVPSPRPRAGHVVIRTRASLVSAGTERMLVDFGRAGLLDKARSQPEKVRQVLDKVLSDGLLPTVDAVRAKLDQPLALGYCNAGEVIAVGAGVTDLAPGDRVVSNGSHAEVVSVPRNLCARIPRRPDGREVTDEEAAFTVLGAIALEGLRLAVPTLGERFVVTGLGLVGLMAAQLLRASGCHVLGIDVSEHRCALARQLGIETYLSRGGGDPVGIAREWSGGAGVDGVLIAASTDSAEPVSQAALMARRRGRIVLLGVVRLELDRAPFYEKELTFQVSCSYGPGRYDPSYEDKGNDYPLGYVRWTAGRNFEAVLDQIAADRLNVAALISHRVPFAEAGEAWRLVLEPTSLGIVLGYPSDPKPLASTVEVPTRALARGTPRIAVIGAGNYAIRTLLPALQDLGVAPVAIAAPGGLSAALSARSFGAARATSDVEEAISAPDVDTVFVLTRHDSHANLVCKALAAGKHVFVEKPLCTTREELRRIREAHRASGRLLMVGFNRRWAPQVQQAVRLLGDVSGPRTILITVNAGAIPGSHWTQDPNVGGGRIVGEACHFVDLARFLAGAAIVDVRASALGGHPDTSSITLAMADGSIATIAYVSTGHPRFGKERIEVFAGGRIVAIDNFRRLHAHGWPFRAGDLSLRQDKGHREMVRVVVDAVRNGGPAPIPFEELAEVMDATFSAAGVQD
ncbi:MAG: bi-domain-containing oxidoreductase [Deltaproteobacteria bacterium]|nr:bi-domain-containing oxidoreductase [Kofleriaceae bacterium]